MLDWNDLRQTCLQCTKCGLCQTRTNVVFGVGPKDADILFVCLGAPKQEMWINNNRDKLNARVALGIGGSLDVFAGTVERAPDFYCKHGLEWFYRLLCDPKRIGRMMKLPKFYFGTWKYKLSKNK